MISDDQIFAIMGLWYHWVLPIMVLVMLFCFAMAVIVEVFPPKDQVRPKKEDKGS